MDELLAALRRNGVVDAAHVRFTILEENGAISVIPRVATGATGSDLELGA